MSILAASMKADRSRKPCIKAALDDPTIMPNPINAMSSTKPCFRWALFSLQGWVQGRSPREEVSEKNPCEAKEGVGSCGNGDDASAFVFLPSACAGSCFPRRCRKSCRCVVLRTGASPCALSPLPAAALALVRGAHHWRSRPCRPIERLHAPGARRSRSAYASDARQRASRHLPCGRRMELLGGTGWLLGGAGHAAECRQSPPDDRRDAGAKLH
jgi:hypothetical protein